MAKLNNYNGSIELPSGLKPKGENDYPLLDAHSIVVDEKGTRLDETLANGTASVGCFHDYEDVHEYIHTCTDWKILQRCTKCEHARVHQKAEGHTLGSWTVTLDPTCTVEGEESATCEVCGHIEKRATAPAGHDWFYTGSKEANCTDDGEIEYSCATCGAYKTEIDPNAPALGHTASEWIIDVEATTVSEGSRHIECTRCGETLETAIIPKLEALTYTLRRDNTYSVKATDQNISGEIEIPSTYNGLPVTVIEGFSNCENITRVKFAEGSNIHTIGNAAFWYCTNLEGIDIPDSVGNIKANAFSFCDKLAYVNVSANSELDSIGSQAFMECYSLANITNLLANVTGIYQETFQGCSKLPNVTFNPDLDEIGARAFDACYGFTEIHIPANVGFIGEDAFRSCKNVETITVDPDNTTYHSALNCLIETETSTIILGCANSKIPETVTTIGGGSFGGGVFGLEQKMFHMIIPASVKTISPLAFKDCENLTIYCEAESIPDGWDENWNDGSATVVWGNSCGIDNHDYVEVVTPPTCTEQGYSTYTCSKCGASYVADPVEALGHSPSDWIIDKEATGTTEGSKHKECTRCGEILETATIPKVENADEYLTYTLLNSGEGYSVKATNVSNLPDELTIPSTYNGKPVLTIENEAFYDGSQNPGVSATFTKVILPDSIKSIGMDAFHYCREIKEINIPIGVEYIAESAFYECTNLTIYCEASSKPDAWDENWNYSNCPVVWGNSDATYLTDENGNVLTDENGNLLTI